MKTSRWPSPHCTRSLLRAVLCAGWVVCPVTSSPAQSVWELTPYRIEVLVTFAPAPELTSRLRDDLLTGLIDRTDALIGAPWGITFAPAPPALGRTMTSAIESVTMESLPKASLDFDKVMLLAVAPAIDGHRVTAREFDARTRLFSTAVTRPVGQLGKLRDVALAAMLEAFAPLGRIERVEKKHRILVLVAPAPEAKLSGRQQTDLLAHLRAQAETLAEDDRDVTVTPAPAELLGVVHPSTEAVAWESFPGRLIGYDEVVLLSISLESSGLHATTLGLNPLAGTSSPPASLPVGQPEGLRATAWEAVSKAIGAVKRGRKTWVTLRLRAGGLPFRDKGLAPVGPGAVFRPVIRYNDRDGNPRRIMPLPWTFCTVEEITSRQLVCRLHTGLRSPLSGRRRGRVRQLALAVVPPQRPSVLTLQSRSDPQQLLAGYDVYSHPPHSTTTVLLGRTDRRGCVSVPPVDKQNPLRVLMVRNGGEPLARLPIVPGMEPELFAAIANDDRRLEAEGIITGLQEEMVDLVARREVLFTRARTRIETGKLDEARELIDELRKLPDGPQFALKLNERQKRVRSGDAAVQAKIDALFDDTHKLLKKHLDPGPIEELWQELRRARGETGS